MMNNKIYTITPNWQAPKHIKALSTLAIGGYSTGQYANPYYSTGLNLAAHVQDNIQDVYKNRTLVKQEINCPIIWLEQVHGIYCTDLDNDDYFKDSKYELGINNTCIRADACFTTKQNLACSVLTADCLPLLVTDKKGQAVLAIHAGWKGLVNGIIENSIDYFMHKTKISSGNILVWLGPAIGANAFEVGNEVLDKFMHFAAEKEKENTYTSFEQNINNDKNKKYADLYKLAKIRLARLDIISANISGGDFCTYFDHRFYSYRRNNVTGRIASIIAKIF